MIGGSVKTELTRELLKTVLLDGFLPRCAPTDQPRRGRRVGLTEIGLPYAADPAITRHLARFLGQQAGSLHTGGAMVLPSAVLFNGGVFKAAELRRRILDVLSDWAGRPVPELESSDLDLAVAHGAAYYGQVRRGQGRADPRRRRRGRTTSASRPPRRRSRASRRRSRPCASCRWAWRKGPRPTSPAPRSAWSSASRPSSGSSARPPAATTPSAPCSSAGTPKSSRSSTPLETALAADDGGSGETVPVRLHSHVTEVGHARALVPEHPRPQALEAGIQRAGVARVDLTTMSDEIILTVDGAGRAAVAADLRRPGDSPRVGPGARRLAVPSHAARGRRDARRDPGAGRRAARGELSDLARRPRRLPRLGAAGAVRGQGIVVYRLGRRPARGSNTAARSAS